MLIKEIRRSSGAEKKILDMSQVHISFYNVLSNKSKLPKDTLVNILFSFLNEDILIDLLNGKKDQ